MKNQQTGHFVVKIRSILAIIAVLALGVVALYNNSLRQTCINRVVDYISKFALAEYATCQQKVLKEGVDIRACHLTSSFYSHKGVQPDSGAIPKEVRKLWFAGVTFKKDAQVDDIKIYASFYDRKLCEAVASIFGSNCRGFSESVILVKQN